MSPDQLTRRVIHGTLSSYLRILVRIVLGLVTFRLLYQGLGAETYGFWSLLWAFFGYGILLDFGFGFAAQKRVAELSARQDWTGLSQVLSTLLGAYLVSAVLAVCLGFAFSGTLISFFQVSPENRDSFQRILQVFLVGVGLAFPLGLFPEILRGQQRATAANQVALVALLGNCAAVVSWAALGLSFLTLVILTLLCVLIPYLWAGWLALRSMPQVRLSPRLFSGSVLLATTRFSVYAYLNMLSHILRTKADQPILAGILGVAAVAPYQAGGKAGEMFGLLTRQLAEVLSPAAAHLHAHGDSQGLRRMLVEGLRYSVLASTPLYIVTAAYMEGLVRILTGLDQPTSVMVWTGQTVLLWYYSLTLTHWVFKWMYLMAGQERRMMWQGLAEAALNITLSIVLTLVIRRPVGVALGALLATWLFGWGLLWGWAAHEARLTRWSLFRTIILPSWLGCLPMITLAAALRFQPWWASGSSTPLVLAEAALLTTVGFAGTALLALSPIERRQLLARLR